MKKVLILAFFRPGQGIVQQSLLKTCIKNTGELQICLFVKNIIIFTPGVKECTSELPVILTFHIIIKY
jgi:hypothetical protein